MPRPIELSHAEKDAIVNFIEANWAAFLEESAVYGISEEEAEELINSLNAI